MTDKVKSAVTDAQLPRRGESRRESGMMPAGLEGLRAIKACGGFAIAQDRASSACFEIPSAAIDWAKAEIAMPPQRIASVLKIIAQRWQDGASIH